MHESGADKQQILEKYVKTHTMAMMLIDDLLFYNWKALRTCFCAYN